MQFPVPPTTRSKACAVLMTITVAAIVAAVLAGYSALPRISCRPEVVQKMLSEMRSELKAALSELDEHGRRRVRGLVLARACCLARMARGPPLTATATLIVVRGVARGEEGGEWGPTLGRCAGV